MVDTRYKEIGDPAIRIIEECSEVIKSVAKGVRFGWFSCHPDRPTSNNLSELEAEMDDVRIAYDDLISHISLSKSKSDEVF